MSDSQLIIVPRKLDPLNELFMVKYKVKPFPSKYSPFVTIGFRSRTIASSRNKVTRASSRYVYVYFEI